MVLLAQPLFRRRLPYSGCGGSSRRMPSSRQRIVRIRRRRAGQRIGAARDLRERDHLADVRLAREQRDEAVDAHREPAVRRRAHRERLEEEAELVALLLLADPHRAEDAPAAPRRRGSGSSRSRAPSRSRSGRNAGRARARDRTRSQLLLARHGRRERVVHERPAAGLLVVLEEREVDDPVEDVEARVDQAELAARGAAGAARGRGRRPLRRRRRRAPSSRPRRRTPRARARRGTSRSA